MRRACLAVVLAFALTGAARAQQVEATIFLPDSIVGLTDPRFCVPAQGGTSVLVGGTDGWVIKLDCGQNAKTARVAVDSCVSAMCSDASGSKVYSAHARAYPRSESVVTVIDPALMTIRTRVRVGKNPVALVGSERHGRIYCVCNGSDSVAMIDCAGDTLVGATPVRPVPLGAAYSETSDRLYVWHWQDPFVSVLDGATGQSVDSLYVGQYPSAAIVEPGSNRLYVGYADKLAVFDCSTGVRVAELGLGRFPTELFHDSTTDRLFCVLTASDAVTVVDCSGPQLLGWIGVGDSPRHIARCGERLICSNRLGNSVTVIDPARMVVTATVATRRQPGVVVSDASGLGYVVHEGNAAVSQVDAGAGQVLRCFMLAEQPRIVCWDLANHHLLCLTQQDRVYAIDGTSHEVRFGIDAGTDPTGLAVDSAGGKFYVSDRSDSFVVVYDANDGSMLNRIKVGTGVAHLGYNSIDRKLYCCRASHVKVIACSTDSVKATISSASGGTSTLFNPASDKLYVVCANTNSVVVVDGATNGVIGTGRGGEDPTSLGLNPLTNEVYCTYPAGSLAIVIGDSANAVVDTLVVPGQPTAVWGDGVTGRAYVGDVQQNKLYFFAAGSHDLVDSIDVVNPSGLFWNPADRLLYASDRGRDVVFAIDPATGIATDTLPVVAGPTTAAFDPARNRIYLMNEDAGAITVIQGGTGILEQVGSSVRGRNLTIAPNPMRQSADLRLQCADGQALTADVRVELFDAAGRRVSSRAFRCAGSLWRIDLSRCPAGVYLARVSAGGLVFDGRLVKSN